ncbi:MAG: histidine--tRNA ligase [Thermoprotei archaeon]|nr:MAG: histidine--tRNA ligase [Thermoprotei archaeon]
MRLQTPRGTRDYLPADMVKRRRIIEKLRETFELYGYGEVTTPAFEYLELLEAKAGEDVREQIYWFKDKGGRKLGLRFEMTTPIARIVAQNPVMPKPIRFYYIQPVWRYEEPQRGRFREFSHAGIELIGYEDVSADAEVIAVTVNALKKTGLNSIEVRLSDRRVLENLLIKYGMDRKLEESFRVLDKLERKGKAYVITELNKLGIKKDNLDKLMSVISIPGSNEEKLDMAEKCLSGTNGVGAIDRLRSILDELKDGYGIASEVKIDYSIVRGLAYYTGMVFEVKTLKTPDLGSVAGGGRYDELIKTIGGPRIPATGMSIGIERLIEALEIKGSLEINYSPAKVLVIPVGEEYWPHVLKLAEKLRNEGIPTIVEMKGRSLSAGLSHAERLKIPYAVIVGKREISTNSYTLRDLKEWKEVKLGLGELISKLKN